MHPLSATNRTARSIATLACLCALGGAPTAAQTTANVSVQAGTSIGTLPASDYGINTGTFDNNMFDAPVTGLLTSLGVHTLRYPGGSWSDNYHWQTNTGTTGSDVYPNPNDNFDAFMTKLAQPVGAQPIITVNYGSNAAGTAGGDPNEAAAWVKYSNVTNHYGVKYWEVGNEIYGNGYYQGADWETDFHWLDQNAAGRVGNPNLSPTTYGQNVNVYAAAMKAQDPTIKVGVVLQMPDGSTNAADWDTKTLAQCGPNIDFVSLHWYPEYLKDNDTGLLGDPRNIANYVAALRTYINQYCGSRASSVQIFITEVNCDARTPGKQLVSQVNALFAADNFATWMENGVGSVNWWDLHNGPATDGDNSANLYGNTNWGDDGLLSTGASPEPAAETPFPPFYGIMMYGLTGSPGDTMVSSTSTNALLKVHTMRRADGKLAVLLINDDPNNSVTANVSLTGYAASGQAILYTYTEGPSIGGSAINIHADNTTINGGSFSVTLSPYSITSVVLGGAVPAFSDGAWTPSTVTSGSTMPLSAWFYKYGVALTNGTVFAQIVDAGGKTIWSQTLPNQTFTNGQTLNTSFQTAAPIYDGTYTVQVGVENLNGTITYGWNSNAAQFTVTGGPPAFNETASTVTVTSPNASMTVNASVADTGAALSNGVVDLEIHDASGNKVAQYVQSGQNFASGQTIPYTFTATAPAIPGAYTLTLGVFKSDWSVNYGWNNSAATFNVNGPDNAQYNFESGTQGWTGTGQVTSVNTTSAQAIAGTHSLAANFNGAAGQSFVNVAAPAVPADRTITFNVWIPSSSPIDYIQPYVLDANGTWKGNWQSTTDLNTNGWNTITLTVPAGAATPLRTLGIQFDTTAAWTGTCYIDSIGW